VRPVGALLTLPLPTFVTVRVEVCGVGGVESCGVATKVAETEVLVLRVTTQVPVPLQPPSLQPLKVEPVAGAAERVTTVPSG
jgi:hypothetical protein